jgi:transcriptional regulator with XRE-family HTH domain
MMARLMTGRQITAARALTDVSQEELAEKTDLALSTIKNMEKCGTGPLQGRADTVRRIQFALEDLGVEFLDHRQPGVRVRKPQ